MPCAFRSLHLPGVRGARRRECNRALRRPIPRKAETPNRIFPLCPDDRLPQRQASSEISTTGALTRRLGSSGGDGLTGGQGWSGGSLFSDHQSGPSPPDSCRVRPAWVCKKLRLTFRQEGLECMQESKRVVPQCRTAALDGRGRCLNAKVAKLPRDEYATAAWKNFLDWTSLHAPLRRAGRGFLCFR